MHVQLHTIPELKSNDAPRHAVISLIQRCPEQPGQSVFVPRPVSYFACIFIIQCCGAKIICVGSFAHNFGSGYSLRYIHICIAASNCSILQQYHTRRGRNQLRLRLQFSNNVDSPGSATLYFLFFIMILQSWPNFCLVGIK